MIPKVLHFIWVGDESRRPNRCIQTWVDLNPGWKVKFWGNAELEGRKWINEKHIRDMAKKEWNGVADLMRWEILFDEGGVLLDADSICLRPLPDWLLECEAFSCWENELAKPGLIAAGYFGTIARTPFLAALINDIRQKPTVVDRDAWQSVGPLPLSEAYRKYAYLNLTILPSHFFIPRHYEGLAYTGGGPVFAHQEWASTLKTYDQLADAPGKAPSGGQTFLLEPDFSGAEWVEVVLSYLEAFSPGEPVALVLALDPAREGLPPVEEVETAVCQIVAETGREAFPDIVVAERPGDVLEALRRFPSATWVPKGQGSTEGLRGPFGERFAAARTRLAGVRA